MKKILFSLLVIGGVIAAISGGTFAYFQDTVSSTENTFTTGSIDLQIRNDGGGWQKPTVSATWTSPAGWYPGQEFTASVHIRNVGSTPVTYLGVNWHKPTGDDISQAILVTGWTETVNGVTRDELAPPPGGNYASLIKHNVAGKFSLKDLAQNYIVSSEPLGSGGVPDEWGNLVAHVTDSVSGNGYDIVPLGTPAIAPGGEFIQTITFKLDPEAGNEVANKTMKMDITFIGAQDLSVLP